MESDLLQPARQVVPWRVVFAASGGLAAVALDALGRGVHLAPSFVGRCQGHLWCNGAPALQAGWCASSSSGLWDRSSSTRNGGIRGRVARWATDDPWEVLGISRMATRAEIKAQFKTLVRRYHPDLNPEGSQRLLRRVIDAAAKVLDSPELRAREATANQERGAEWTSSGGPQPQHANQESDPMANVLLYAGTGRIRGPIWPVYRVTFSEVEVSWPRGPQGRAPPDSLQRVKFTEIRAATTGLLDLQTGRCDLKLDLAWGTRLVLERLPEDIAKQIQQLIQVAQMLYQRRRATVLDRVPRTPRKAKAKRYRR